MDPSVPDADAQLPSAPPTPAEPGEIDSPPSPLVLSVTPVPPEGVESRDERRERLLAAVGRLPTGPGVYIFRNAEGAVAYVGKARNLRERVRSYFTGSRGDSRRAVVFVDRYVHALEFVSTQTEPEAFLLENRLVKRHKPAYNVKLRDDKDFLYVRVDRRHDFPALGLARRPKARTRDVTFHGPFASAHSLRRTLRTLGSILPLRDCSDREFASRTRPCLKHDMGRCCAPCVGLVTREEYAALLDEALEVLAGRAGSVQARLQERMAGAANEMRFEEAARLRDQIRFLRAATNTQQVENIGLPDGDVVGRARAGDLACLVVLFFRGGTLVSSTAHTLDSELPDEELLEGFLLEFYADGRPVPREVLLPVELPEASALQSLLAERRGGAVDLSTPQRGERRALIELAARNAQHALDVAVEDRGHQAALLDGLKERLALPRVPEIIECYDISNTGRSGIVASRVVFKHGEPDRARYRNYRMKTVEGQDDYASLAEVLRRRLARAATDPLPDLLMVDGGKGQLGVAETVREELGLADLPLAAIAKGGRRGRAVTLDEGEQERIFLPGRAEPIVLDRQAPEEYLLQRLRDEAHRFAISHHRKVRSKESLGSRLDDVPGVGPVLRKRLLTSFGGMRELERASVEQIAAVRGVGAELAQVLHDHLSR
jgi:excinuclease ABC subunit C